MPPPPPQPIILASTSRYRRRLLERLELPFTCEAPGTDEAHRPGESAADLATRLSVEKALAVSRARPDHLVIGSDQVASIGEMLLGKPGDAATAVRQLACSSGQTVLFHTAVALARGPAVVESRCVATTVRFRALEAREIEAYVAREEPFDCAGSFRWEGLGIALFESLHSEDPTALEGLPLIATAAMLRTAGIKVI